MEWIDIKDKPPSRIGKGYLYIVCTGEFGQKPQVAFAWCWMPSPILPSETPPPIAWYLDEDQYGLENPHQIAQVVTHYVEVTLP